MLTCIMMRFLSFLLMGLSCEVVMVPYVDAVVVVTVMRVLFFLLHVCTLRECEGDGNAGVGDGCGECRACGWYTWFRYYV